MKRIIYAGTFVLSALFFGCDKDGDGIVNRRDPIDNRTGKIDNPRALNNDNMGDNRGVVNPPMPNPKTPMTIGSNAPTSADAVWVDKDKMGAIDEMFLKSAQDDLAEVKAELARGEDPSARCIKGNDYRDSLKAKTSPQAEMVMTDLTKICNYEAPIKVMEWKVEAAEKAHLAKPTDKNLSECTNSDYKRAYENLSKNHPTDQKFRDLWARWDKVCK